VPRASRPVQTVTRRARCYMDRPGAQLVGLIAAAGILDLVAATGLAYVAGFNRMRTALLHPDWTWLAVMACVLCISFAGYYCAYRAIYRAENGYRLPCRRLLPVVIAGFGGFFAHRGTSPDDLALQQAGADQRESLVRAGALGGLEHLSLALIGCTASIVALCLRLAAPPVAATLPWAVIPIPAALAVLWAAGRYAPALRGRAGWRGRILVFLDTALLVRQLLLRPRNSSALAGMLVFWAAEIAAVWAGLAAFGLRMDAAALIVGFCTGMVATRRVVPLAGAGLLMLFLALTIWYSGAPLTVAIAGTFAYRALTLWLPMPFSLAALPALRRIGRQAAARSVGESGEEVRVAA
jgi:hypothetical protein